MLLASVADVSFARVPSLSSPFFRIAQRLFVQEPPHWRFGAFCSAFFCAGCLVLKIFDERRSLTLVVGFTVQSCAVLCSVFGFVIYFFFVGCRVR